MNDANTEANTKRTYRRITKSDVARFAAERQLQGNGTRAVRVLTPGYAKPDNRAVALSAKQGELSSDEYVEQRLEQIAAAAIDRVNDIVNSPDEPVALKASIFAIEQRRGKAVQKSINLNGKLNIQDILA